MSLFTFAFLSIIIGAIWSIIHLQCNTRQKNQRKLPPGPPALPIIGHLHILGNLPHRTFQDLAKRYGPIMSIRLGSVPAIIVSSPEAAELILKTHDTAFSSRPKTLASEYLSYGSKGLVFSEDGPYWRNVRKLCTLELLSVPKTDSYADMRRAEMGLLVESLKKAAVAREVVDVSEKVATFIEDVTCTMVFGRCSDERFNMKGVVHEMLALAGAFNAGDFVPFLRPFDIQGLNRRLKAASKAMDKILNIIIDEHEQDASRINQKHNVDFIDVMLSLMNKSSSAHDDLSYSIDRKNIKAIIIDMIAGSLETSTTAIEWIISELLRNPRVMTKLQEELKSVVGEDKMVEETDLQRFEYLDIVIKESLRLHPVAPLLIPRQSMENIVIGEYFVPKKSRIFVNSWAIGRDPNVWSKNAEEFIPERFAGSDINLRGRHFQLLPFGSGRRSCPGMHLGLTNIRLVVAQLAHCFDWELPHGMSPNELGMSEKFGLSLPRDKHLLAIPTHRLHGKNLKKFPLL